MSILDAYEQDLATASTALPYQPQPRKQEATKFNAWKTATAAPRGVASGAAETSGLLAEILGAFGQVSAATYTGDMFGGMTQAQRQESEDASRKLREQGLEFSNEAGDLFRDVGRSYRPDATTAGTAERLLFDFSRFASKAVGYSMAGGPWVGAVGTGLDEGMAASDDLRLAGVDQSTRTKVGAVTAVAAGAGVALPVAGKTLPQTLGLVALGGPVGFMAQQAATKEVLKAANYDELSSQYDPFDPVGLAVSTLVPAGFGAFALRRARLSSKAKAVAGVEDAARVEVEPPRPESAVTREQVDAAMVANQQELRASRSLAEPTDLPGQARHEVALGRAEDQMARGEQVNIADEVGVIGATERDANFRAWFGESKVVNEQGEPLVVYHGTGKSFDAFDVNKTGGVFGTDRVGVFFTSGPAEATKYADMAQAITGGDAQVVPAFVSLRNPAEVAVSVDSLQQEPARWFDERKYIAEQALAEGKDGVIISNATGDKLVIAFRPEQIKSAIGNSGRFDPASASLTDPLPQLARQIAGAVDSAQREAGIAPRETSAPASGAAMPTDAAPAKVSEAQAVADEVAANTSRLAEIQATSPDVQVMLDGMDSPMRLTDFLEQVQREADEMLADAPDFQVAAECFLSNVA